MAIEERLRVLGADELQMLTGHAVTMRDACGKEDHRPEMAAVYQEMLLLLDDERRRRIGEAEAIEHMMKHGDRRSPPAPEFTWGENPWS